MTDEDRLFDPVHVEELERMVGAATGVELVETFLASLRELTDRIEGARRVGDTRELRAAGHGLAGAALSIGAVPLGERARAVQVACDREEADRAVAEAGKLIDLARRTEAAFVAFLAERESLS